jgi:hypothetical protein
MQKKSYSNALYFGPHKNDKFVDLNMHIQIYIFIRVFVFM